MRSSTITFDYDDDAMNHHLHLPISAFKLPEDNETYRELEALLDELIDIVRGNESHPLAVAMQIIGDNLERYDDMHAQKIGHDVSHIDMVKHLMQAENLVQKDLAPIFGSQANVSKFLNGKRPLSLTQIVGLKRRFNISTDFFLS